MCLIPLFFTKTLNSAAINYGPLSLTIWSGMPFLANIDLNSSIVLVVLVVVMGTTSGHFE
jgi:hypothetical protein